MKKVKPQTRSPCPWSRGTQTTCCDLMLRILPPPQSPFEQTLSELQKPSGRSVPLRSLTQERHARLIRQLRLTGFHFGAGQGTATGGHCCLTILAGLGRWLVCHTTMESAIVICTEQALALLDALPCSMRKVQPQARSPCPWSRGAQTTCCDI